MLSLSSVYTHTCAYRRTHTSIRQEPGPEAGRLFSRSRGVCKYRFSFLARSLHSIRPPRMNQSVCGSLPLSTLTSKATTTWCYREGFFYLFILLLGLLLLALASCNPPLAQQLESKLGTIRKRSPSPQKRRTFSYCASKTLLTSWLTLGVTHNPSRSRLFSPQSLISAFVCLSDLTVRLDKPAGRKTCFVWVPLFLWSTITKPANKTKKIEFSCYSACLHSHNNSYPYLPCTIKHHFFFFRRFA